MEIDYTISTKDVSDTDESLSPLSIDQVGLRNEQAAALLFNQALAEAQQAADHPFYRFIRDNVVYMCVFVALFALAFALLRVWRRRVQRRTGRVVTGDSVAAILCTSALAVAIGAMWLVPFTVISSHVMLFYPHNFYVQWLHSDLIAAMWSQTYWLTNIALLIVLPFAFFYHEAADVSMPTLSVHGMRGLAAGSAARRRAVAAMAPKRRLVPSAGGLLAQLRDALVSLGLFVVLVLGVLYVLHNLLFRAFVQDYVKFAYNAICFGGSTLALVCLPRGFRAMLRFTLEQFEEESEDGEENVGEMNGKVRREDEVEVEVGVDVDVNVDEDTDEEEETEYYDLDALTDALSACEFELYAQRRRLNGLAGQLSVPSGDARRLCLRRIRRVEARARRLQERLATANSGATAELPPALRALRRRLGRKWWRRWRRCVRGVALGVVCVACIVYTCLESLEIVGEELLGYDHYALLGDLGEAAHHDRWAMLIETVTVTYLMVATFVGVMAMAPLRARQSMARLDDASSATHFMIVRTAVILFISSSFPIVSHALGVIEFDLLGDYRHTGFLRSNSFLLVYNLVFLVQLLYFLSVSLPEWTFVVLK